MHFIDQVCAVCTPAITSDSVSIVANQRAQLHSGVLVELLFTPLQVIVWHHLRSTRDTLALITITLYFYVVNPFSLLWGMDTSKTKDHGSYINCLYGRALQNIPVGDQEIRRD